MKVLHVNILDTLGAGVAAYRLHKALKAIGIDSSMLVRSSTREDDTVIQTDNNTWQVYVSKIYGYLNRYEVSKYKNRQRSIFSNSSFSKNLVKKIHRLNPDIVHLHWFCRGYLSIRSLPKIQRPLVVSLHDMWAFTGGCHYSGSCDRYTQSCGSCPMLGSTSDPDLSTYYQQRKRNTFTSLDKVIVVGLSHWMAQTAASSRVFQDIPVHHLPNCIDCDEYHPMDKKKARREFGIPEGKKVVLFGAHDPFSDPRKGGKYLISALNEIQDPSILLVSFGESQAMHTDLINQPVSFLGKISDPKKLVQLYSLADVVVVPSVEENLSNVIMESLACGVPVVCFNTGGNGDMVTHQMNGYIAENRSAEDLARGIAWCLESEERLRQLSAHSRETAERHFSSEKIAHRYKELYTTLLT